jgi:predicted transcriptional regulator
MDARAYCSLPEDSNREEFNKQRKALYTFDVYNPETKKIEHKDFSKLIDVEVKIDEVARTTIQKCEAERLTAMRKLYILTQKDNPYRAAVIAAQRLLRRKIHCMDGDVDTRLTELETQQTPNSKPLPQPKTTEEPTTTATSEPEPTSTTKPAEAAISEEEKKRYEEKYAQAKGQKETVYTTEKGAEILHQRYKKLHPTSESEPHPAEATITDDKKQRDQERYAQAKGQKETVYTTEKGAEILYQRYKKLHSR